MHAAINSDEHLTNLLVNYTANLNLRDKDSKTALLFALEQTTENLALIDKLLVSTNLNAENTNFLQMAVQKGHIKSLAKLIERGANVDQISKNTGNFRILTFFSLSLVILVRL